MSVTTKRSTRDFWAMRGFIQRVVERVPQAEVRPGGRKVRFERLISAPWPEFMAAGAKDLTCRRDGQRAWAKPRAQLAYVARSLVRHEGD